jgi:capsid protein
LSWLGRIFRPSASKGIKARYDAAQTTSLNRRHWGMADALSADAALSPMVRRTLRNRARYEHANNSYLAGMMSTLATDLIGSGPRLQLDLGPNVNPDRTRVVEESVYEWTLAIDLASKLRIMRTARAVDGEVFALATTNRKLEGVQLDVKLVECDQCQDPAGNIDPQNIDGVRFDGSGNPSSYYFLRHHPGAIEYAWTNTGRWIDSDDVFHWFHATRPGQHRGVGEIVPALELFAMLRRYTLAVVTAAETAADFAAILHTNTPGGGRESTDLDAWETMPMARGMIVAAPEGWAPTQMKPEQPMSQYDMFVRAILNEIARCLNLPFNVAALNSSSYNYASGRMDYQVYHKHLRTLRMDLERQVLDRLLAKYFDEAALVQGLIPDGLPPVATWNWSWTWDGNEHVDPLKEANAEGVRLSNNTTTLADVCAKAGKDWRQVLIQRAAERAMEMDLGLVPDLQGEPMDGTAEDTAEDASQ